MSAQFQSTLPIDGFSLDRNALIQVARGRDEAFPNVELSDAATDRCRHLRDVIERDWLQADPGKTLPAIYGFNTGVGVLKDRQVDGKRLTEFQKLYIRSHCTGVGEPFDDETVRGAMLVRANSLASGYSGVTVALLESLVTLINRQIHPIVPRVGSLGASGDLAPLAHVGAVLMGEPEARVRYRGEVMRLADLPDSVRPTPLELAPKEAMALTNGTSFMLAELGLLLEDAEHLLRTADIAASLSLEAMLGEDKAFDPRLHAVRGHPGQERVARNIRSLLANGESRGEALRAEYLRGKVRAEFPRQEAAAKAAGIPKESLEEFRVVTEQVPRVQDAYSLRCVPQVHGASRDAIVHVNEVFDREINAVTDNPLIFPLGDGYEPLSGGNFHGQPLALAADYASMALSEIGSISERRLFRLLNSNLSYGLPSNLTGGKAGINTGLMIAQYTTAALVTESKTLSSPACVDTIPTSGSQEDHVSMGLWAARKARQVLRNSQTVVAVELLAAAQGVDLLERRLGRNRQLGIGARTAYTYLRDHGITTLEEDRYLEADLLKVQEIVGSSKFVDAVNAALEEPLC